MPSIQDCRDAGLAESLLIPVCPPFLNPSTGKMDGGKAPGVPDGQGGWVGLDRWEQADTLAEIKDAADRLGANCGLVLGTPNQEGHLYVAIDMDLDVGQETHRNRLLNQFARQYPHMTILVRETVPYRAALLVKVKDMAAPGSKTVYKLVHDGEKIGKIEVLTKGQQCVIAGQHPIAGQIKWMVFGQDQRYRAPPITAGMPETETFLDLIEVIHVWLGNLQGYTYESYSHGANTSPSELVPEWLTTKILIEIIDATPNPIDVDRDGYVAFLEAVAACKAGIEERHGPMPVSQSELLAWSAAKWAAKWPGNEGKPDALGDEKAKWDGDWSKQRGGFSTGWHRLIGLAGEFGYTDAACADAAYEFASLVEPAPAPIGDHAPMNTAREEDVKAAHVNNSVKSEFSVEEYLRFARQIDQQYAFLPEWGWIWWDAKKGGWRMDERSARIGRRIEFELKNYVAQFGNGGADGEGWKEADVNRMLSANMVRKVRELMERHLIKLENDRKDARYHIQTLVGSYDLTTCSLASPADRVRMFDIRYTNVTPVLDAPTPNLDRVLLGLAEGDEEVVEWVWHYLGYALMGDPKADCFLVIWGPGGNGKTTLLQALAAVLGDYQVDMNPKVLMESGKNLHPTSLNRLRGRRLAHFSELPAKEKWNEHLLKQMTGGDRIQARNMHQNESDFRSEAALLFATNELPKFTKVNQAILRRYRLVGTTWQPRVPDLELENKLREEAPAILGRLMRYAQAVYRNGMRLPDVPSKMMAQRDGQLRDNDPFFAWVNSECDYGPAVEESTEFIQELLDRYKAWLARTGKGGVAGDVIDEKQFKDALWNFNVATRDKNGNALRRLVRNGGDAKHVHIAKGIRLKVKAA